MSRALNTGSGRFTLKGDAAYGAHGKYTITYSLWVRSSSGTFAAGNYVDIALDLEGKWPNGTAATGVAETQRHMLIPSVSSQRLSGVFEFATGVGTTSGYVYLKMTGNRANVIPGLDPTDDGRGTISFRAHA